MKLLMLSCLTASASSLLSSHIAGQHSCLRGCGRAAVVARYVQGQSELEEDAAALLEENNGDVEKARTSYIGYTLAYLEEAMPELYDALKTDPKRPDAHAAIVEVTWDAIAAFLPVTHDPNPTPEAQKRLTAISRAAVVQREGGEDLSRFLDVGCGNGLLLPFATAVGCPPEAYRGIDLSSRMIETAQKAHGDETRFKGATFDDKSFDDVVKEAEAEGGTEYDAIVFNGSVQFFADLRAALSSAAGLLKKGPDSRLVLAHVSGGGFVKRERDENPMTVLSVMPTLAELGDVASELGLNVVTPSFMGSEASEIERFLDDFYLVVLRWNAENGGDDGEGGDE